MITLCGFSTQMNHKTTYSDQEILQMLDKEDRRKVAIAFLYRSARESVIRMVIKYGGQEDDALEILSEGIMVFLRNIDRGKFLQQSQLRVYLIGICKFLWRDQRKKDIFLKQKTGEALQEPVAEVVDHLEQRETVRAIQMCLDRMKEACRELFRLRYFEGEAAPWEVVADRLGYDSAQVARNRGQRCMKSLKTIYFEISGKAND